MMQAAFLLVASSTTDGDLCGQICQSDLRNTACTSPNANRFAWPLLGLAASLGESDPIKWGGRI